MKLKISIKTKSPLHLGSGRANVVVDADAVYDEYGLPYLPAKRLKGVLYESALEVVEMLELCQKSDTAKRETLERIFGQTKAEAKLIIHDFHLEDYDKLKAAWSYLEREYNDFIAPEDVLEEYSELRYQTKIDKKTGTAAKGSLHNMRVIDAGVTFAGQLELLEDSPEAKGLIALALANLHYIGGKRNRGFGGIECTMPSELQELVNKAL